MHSLPFRSPPSALGGGIKRDLVGSRCLPGPQSPGLHSLRPRNRTCLLNGVLVSALVQAFPSTRNFIQAILASSPAFRSHSCEGSSAGFLPPPCCCRF